MEETQIERLVLVVEDNAEHLQLIEQALQQNSVQHRIVAIASGNQAMDFLYRRGDYTGAPRPDLILLDLNLPDQDGRSMLAEIKTAPHLKRIPIVVLTLSDDEGDVLKIYSLQGNSYVIKSSDLDQLFHIVRRIEEFWLGIVTLPVE